MSAPPVDRSTRVRVQIERLVAGGDALAREPSGRVVFVPGALPGETVEIVIDSAKKDFARGRLLSVIDASTARLDPPCPALARGCGGCDWQHVDPTYQLEQKASIVAEALRRTAKLATADVAIAGRVEPWAYRTSLRLALDTEGWPALRRARSNDLVVLDDCLIAHPALASMLPEVCIPGAEEVSLRVGASTGQRTAWWQPVASGPVDVPGDVSTGPGAAIIEHAAGVELRVSAASFFQSGPAAAELLVDTVRALCSAELATAGTVIDAYGGVGLFSAALVPATTSVVVVEGSAAACADATVNLAGRRARVVCSAVERWTPERADLVIADPSRDGLGKRAVEVLAATEAPTIVLVSCDPVALARDTNVLHSAGYAHTTTRVLDLCPQTHHVEAVTRFDRRDD